jgi:hypothetical protein
MLLPIPDIIFEDWQSVQTAIEQIRFHLSTDASPKFAGISLEDLIASRLIATDSGKVFESVADLTAWITGTNNQIIVTNDGDGTITLSTPQDIHTDATPEFAGFVIKDSDDNIVAYMSDSEFYITYTAPAEIVTGNPIGLLLALTYTV